MDKHGSELVFVTDAFIGLLLSFTTEKIICFLLSPGVEKGFFLFEMKNATVPSLSDVIIKSLESQCLCDLLRISPFCLV